MSDHNHGSAATSVQRVLDNHDHVVRGLYRISNIYFVMPGVWDLRFTLKDANFADETYTIRETIPTPSGP